MARRRHPRRIKNERGRRTRGRGRENVVSSIYARVGETKITEDDIIGFLYKNREVATIEEIREGIGLARGYRQELRHVLQALCAMDRLRLIKGRQYQLSGATDFVEGVISGHPRGFAFAQLSAPLKDAGEEREVFIPAGAMKTANHGDRVLLKITGRSRKGLEGKVIRVLSRSFARLVGIYTAGRTTGLVLPEDERFPFSILVRKEHSCGAKNGEAVVAEITRYPEAQRNPEGRILEVLGNPRDLQVQTDMVIRKFELPHAFDEEVLEETGRLDDTIVAGPDRTDLRDVLHVTIDGETARDFDDAVSVTKGRYGYRLYVSIADVSHYVIPGSALDREAYRRGTSVYFPTRVVPMLPERLSNQLCSLVPDEDRLAFSAILDFDKNGTLKKKRFTKSIIRSRHRLTYTIVKRILVDRDPELRKTYKPILTLLNWMSELSGLLEKRRMDRGSIGFEIPEPVVALTADGKVAAIARSERTTAHKLIEEFMLAANEAVAETFSAVNGEAWGMLYRIHESPDPIKVAEFAEFARTMGLDLRNHSGTPEWFGAVLRMVAGTPQEYIVNNLLLRIMKQACYSPNNVGHFGLAAPYYTHFTSPIRRYPDLMVHRALARLLSSAKKRTKTEERPEDTDEAGLFLSKRERVAIDAEREMTARLQAEYMADRVGESFDGVVSGVSGFGMFVELLTSFVSGAVAITDMTDDYYRFDEKAHRLIGRRTNRIFRIGDLVRVRVASVDPRRHHINFICER